MKVYLMTDLEGVAGVYQWENRDDASLENHERRCRQRKWMVREVNAAVEGFFAGGATEIIVNDGHGAGYTIDLDELDPRVEVINGRERPFWLPYLDETCDATAIVGAHAKACTKGACLWHSMNLGIRDYSANGTSIGEMGLQAIIAGHYGVPFIFCSGDAYACREIEALIPGCATVAVKKGLSRLSAKTYTPERAREMIRKGAQEAMSRVGRVQPLDLGRPIRFRVETFEPQFDIENPPPHSRVIDSHTREIEADDPIDLLYKYYPDTPRDWRPFEATEQK